MAPSPALGADATAPAPAASDALDMAPAYVDTVIVGSGPSALLLSWILHGHHPYTRPAIAPHPDPQLQAKLASGAPSLFDADPAELTAHFHASRLSYSTQALPVNTLLDTLLRPLADTAPGAHQPCLEWRRAPGRAVSHVVIGAEERPGGQWQAECVAASGDIGALSYGELLSLPQYSLEQHMARRGKAVPDGDLLRPSRDDVASYLAAWPAEVGVAGCLRLGKAVSDVRRLPAGGFHVAPHNLRCRRVVLATGIFSHRLPPRSLLQPLLRLQPAPPPSPAADLPLLVIGSGFSAADLILTHLPRGRRILHLFKWDPADKPSPLRACHPAAYPEYASVFRRMKRAAALATATPGNPAHSIKRRRSSTYAALERPEWDPLYEGLPNARIHAVHVRADGESAAVLLQRPGGGLMERAVCGLEYVVGRRGSLAYLAPALQSEVLSGGAPLGPGGEISNKTLREKAEDRRTLEMAPDVFAVGSLLGDSLIRHSYGGCVAVAGELTRRAEVERGGAVEATAVGTERLEGRATSARKRSFVEAGHDERPSTGGYGRPNGYDSGAEYDGAGVLANIDGHIMPLLKAYGMGGDRSREGKINEACVV